MRINQRLAPALAAAVVPVVIFTLITMASPTTLLAEEVNLTSTPLPMDPCSIQLYGPQAFNLVKLPPEGPLKSIEMYSLPEGVIISLLATTYNITVYVETEDLNQNTPAPVTCVISRDKNAYETRIGPLPQQFGLRVLVNGQEYLIVHNPPRQQSPAYQPDIQTTVKPAVAKVAEGDEEEEEYDELEESEEKGKGQQAYENEQQENRPSPPGDRGVTPAEDAGKVEERSPQAPPRILVQTLPLAAGTVTFIIVYLVSRKVM